MCLLEVWNLSKQRDFNFTLEAYSISLLFIKEIQLVMVCTNIMVIISELINYCCCRILLQTLDLQKENCVRVRYVVSAPCTQHAVYHMHSSTPGIYVSGSQSYDSHCSPKRNC